ncbi:glutaredoxin-like [Xenia sp. Carnegie-2017]|uniref:glutaredoxin-like n=1 Tax=Xenia sp. Carnegie-2017 TaxID=2897299 RepID=UPI001F048DEE|nr:glutaredoxin-like [Xenia sp. Carnegie-2017]
MGSAQSNDSGNNEEIKTWIENEITSNLVVVFSKTYCPYCRKAKNALKAAGLEKYTLHELDRRDDGEKILDILRDMTGGRTVPRVFINGKFVGGGSEVEAMQEKGELVPLLKSCGAL